MTYEPKNSTQRICLKCGAKFPADQQTCPHDGTRLADALRDRFIGTTFAEKYEIQSLLGRGGMSVVYRARHLFMDRTVAIKMLRSELISDGQTLQRFQQESKALSSLNHPNIMMVYDFGVTEDGVPYLVMDYLHGDTLANLISQYGRMPIDKALNVFLQACDALAHAHLKNVVHRDIKPSNLVITRREDGFMVLRIVDFGIAKMLQREGTQGNQLTQTGEIFGSPLYMSPEQCVGKRMDWRSDIYSLGCVMYEALTGRPPLVGETSLETILMQTRETPPSFAAAAPGMRIPSGLEAIVFTAMNKNPELRQQSMEELSQELRKLAAQLGISVVPAQAGTHGTIPLLAEVAREVDAEQSQSMSGTEGSHAGHRHTRKGEFRKAKAKSGPNAGLIAVASLVCLVLGAILTLGLMTGRVKLPVDASLSNQRDGNLQVKNGESKSDPDGAEKKKTVPGYADPNVASLPPQGDAQDQVGGGKSTADLVAALPAPDMHGAQNGAVEPSPEAQTSSARARNIKQSPPLPAAAPLPDIAPASPVASNVPLPSGFPAPPDATDSTTPAKSQAEPQVVAKATPPSTVTTKIPSIGAKDAGPKPPPIAQPAVVAMNDKKAETKGEKKDGFPAVNVLAFKPSAASAPKANKTIDSRTEIKRGDEVGTSQFAASNSITRGAASPNSATKSASSNSAGSGTDSHPAGRGSDHYTAMTPSAVNTWTSTSSNRTSSAPGAVAGSSINNSNSTLKTARLSGQNSKTSNTASQPAIVSHMPILNAGETVKTGSSKRLPPGPNLSSDKMGLNLKPTTNVSKAQNKAVSGAKPATNTLNAQNRTVPGANAQNTAATNAKPGANLNESNKTSKSTGTIANAKPAGKNAKGAQPAGSDKAPAGLAVFKTARVFCYYPKGWKAGSGNMMTLTCPGASIILTRHSGTLAAYLLTLDTYFAQIGARRGEQRTEVVGKYKVVSQIATVPNRDRTGGLTMYRMDWLYGGQVYSLIGQSPVPKTQALVYCVRKIAESLEVR